MYSNTIGDDGMSSVADGLQHNNTLTKLNVPLCQISMKGTYVAIATVKYKMFSYELACGFNQVYLYS